MIHVGATSLKEAMNMYKDQLHFYGNCGFLIVPVLMFFDSFFRMESAITHAAAVVVGVLGTQVWEWVTKLVLFCINLI